MIIEERPAHNAEAEQAFLASLLLDGPLLSDSAPILDEDDFYIQPHRQIYRIIRTLAGSGQPVDRAAVVTELTRAGSFGIDEVGRYVDRISESVQHAANGRFYAEIIRMKRIERDIVACQDRARGPVRENGTPEV